MRAEDRDRVLLLGNRLQETWRTRIAAGNMFSERVVRWATRLWFSFRIFGPGCCLVPCPTQVSWPSGLRLRCDPWCWGFLPFLFVAAVGPLGLGCSSDPGGKERKGKVRMKEYQSLIEKNRY